MELYDVVNAFSIILKEGMLILHRSMTEHPKFKVYKNFNYNLYHVKGKEKELLLTETMTLNTPLDKIEEVWKKQDVVFMAALAEYFMSNKFRELCNV